MVMCHAPMKGLTFDREFLGMIVSKSTKLKWSQYQQSV